MIVSRAFGRTLMSAALLTLGACGKVSQVSPTMAPSEARAQTAQNIEPVVRCTPEGLQVQRGRLKSTVLRGTSIELSGRLYSGDCTL